MIKVDKTQWFSTFIMYVLSVVLRSLASIFDVNSAKLRQSSTSNLLSTNLMQKNQNSEEFVLEYTRDRASGTKLG